LETVHYDVPGSRRAETNEWGNMINAMAYMIPPIIEKMDTASLDIKHGNSTMIYATTHLTPPAVVDESTDHNKECDGKQCQHQKMWFPTRIQIEYQFKLPSASHSIWGSLACGRNYYLNSNVDEDFFYSLTTVASEHGLQEDIDRYSMDADVCNYFTFAEQGTAVALRPGDMLIFNLRNHHCLSSRTSIYESDYVFCLHCKIGIAFMDVRDVRQTLSGQQDSARTKNKALRALPLPPVI
jgi:hypothetical protein